MDPLTHTLLGAALGYAVHGRRLGRQAAVIGGLAAFVPDADVFIRSTADPLVAIEHHRGFTHALPFAPVGAAAVATLVRFWRRDGAPAWLAAWACAATAYVSHCLLDAATTYGTQLLWPFSRHRFSWDLVSVIDPMVTLTLAAGLTFALRHRRRHPAVVALAAVGSYLALGGVQHARAVETQRRLAASRGHEIERAEVMPTLGNNIIWRALYVSSGRIHSDRIRVGWFGKRSAREGTSLPLVTETDLTPAEQARNGRRSFERFAWFSDGWVARSPADPALLADVRYSLSTAAFDPIWGIRFTAPGAPAEVEWVNRTRERNLGVAELWREVGGADPRYEPLAGEAQRPAARARGLPGGPDAARASSRPTTPEAYERCDGAADVMYACLQAPWARGPGEARASSRPTTPEAYERTVHRTSCRPPACRRDGRADPMQREQARGLQGRTDPQATVSRAERLLAP